MLGAPAVTALNHLLAQNAWALPRLARLAGKTARFTLFPFSFSCTVRDDGTLATAADDASADATCIVPPSLLPRLALHDESALDQIDSVGDAALIQEILFLARNMRWDAAEDLSRFTGDIAAERIVGFAESAGRHVRQSAVSLSQAMAEYWTEERPLIAKAQPLAAFGQEVTRLGEAVEALEQRIQQLSKTE